MGHDTRAYLGRSVPADLERVASPEELREEIAYLPGNYGLYEALDAQFYDGKVSGIGIGRWFARAQGPAAEIDARGTGGDALYD